MTDLERANKYWEEQKERVERIAEENGIEITLEEHDDEYLFELFDCGDLELTDEEVLEALKEDWQ